MIRFDHVSKSYGAHTAVREFTLEIPSHSCLVLVGSSGSGKTTLLRMVNRMVRPSSGRVLIDDMDVAELDPVRLRRSIGYVMQNGGLLPHRTVLDNILTVPRLRKERVGKKDAYALMERVGLDIDLAGRYPGELSGGQAQRVGVARALIFDPDILLMDEPFAAVDPMVRCELQEQIARLQRQLGKTIVFVTHDLAEACFLGDRVAVLSRDGVLEQVGTPRQIVAAPANDFVRRFIGSVRGVEVER